MKGNDRIIATLNLLLADELTAIHQYMVQSEMCDNWGYEKFHKDGAPAFIAYRGRVYDVSQSFLWQHGSHQALHAAGGDLTTSLGAALHDGEVLKRFPLVGVLDVD